MFTLALLGSSLYGGMTVASAYAIGEITDRVILPAFRDGRMGVDQILAVRPDHGGADLEPVRPAGWS